MEIGTTLITARTRAGLSAAQVAARSEVPRQTVRRLEKNDLRWVTFSQLRKVARTVNCRVEIVPIHDAVSPGLRRNKLKDEF